MKIRLVFAIMTVILALSLPACTPAAGEATLLVTYDDFTRSKNITRELAVQEGHTIKVTVASNPTTGFKWNLVAISDAVVLKQDGESEYVPPESTLIGAGGEEIWTFKALKRGTSRVSLAYSRPWEGGAKGEWTLDINVTVR